MNANIIELNVPYFSQRDSATNQGDRMCFSSTCAMAARFFKPQSLSGSGQADDQYLALVRRYGDTTEPSAQIQALEALGIRARFRTDGTLQALKSEIEAGRPVAAGWLHKGPATSPRGDGHWSLVVGRDRASKALIIHDPFGEANLVGGGYVTTAIGSGKSQRYSERNWGRRWMVEGVGSGWWLDFSHN